MARLAYSGHALADLERLTDFLIETDLVAAVETIGLIEEAVELLIRHPLIGRPIEHGLRELVSKRPAVPYWLTRRAEVEVLRAAATTNRSGC